MVFTVLLLSLIRYQASYRPNFHRACERRLQETRVLLNGVKIEFKPRLVFSIQVLLMRQVSLAVLTMKNTVK